MNRGDKGDVGSRNVRLAGDAKVILVGVGVRLKKNVGDSGDIPTPNVEPMGDMAKPGDIAMSNIDRGDAGMRGEAIRKSGCCVGGTRNGLTGDIGVLGENGEGVSGSQYDSAGTGRVRVVFVEDEVGGVHSGKVARRGVGGRGALHDGVAIVRDIEAQWERMLTRTAEST
jgi:hypothetical protein